MLKKVYRYILSLFVGPFLGSFSVLFFIFIIQFIWTKLNDVIGKGLDFLIIVKLIFYFGISVVPLILPATVLLSSIMVYGGLGERYELTAIKSSGTSLWKAMRPIFTLVIFLAVGSYVLSDFIVPASQRKFINLMYNVSKAQPALHLTEGAFIDSIPNVIIKIGEKTGEKGEQLKEIFIFSNEGNNKKFNTILAKRGLIRPSEKKNYLRLDLFDGTLYNEGGSSKEENKSYRKITFSSLKQLLDISALENKDLEEEVFSYMPIMLSVKNLLKNINTLEDRKKKSLSLAKEEASTKLFLTPFYIFEKNERALLKSKEFDNLDVKSKKETLQRAKNSLEDYKNNIRFLGDNFHNEEKQLTKSIIELHKKFSLSITCILMFLIAAPLGATIRKGGMGLPVVISLIIFISYYTLLTISQSLGEKQIITPWLGAWAPNIIMFPIGAWFTYKKTKDLPILDTRPYLNSLARMIKILTQKTP